MKYKVGDTVKIKSLNWYNENKDKDGSIYHTKLEVMVDSMSIYCGKTTRIMEKYSDFYLLEIDNGYWKWNDWMFEDEEKELKKVKRLIKDYCSNVCIFDCNEDCPLFKLKKS